MDYDGDGIYEALLQQSRIDELCEAKYAFGEDRELDIYIDESGNLDSRASSSAWYIMCFVLKESSVSTEDEEGKLEEEFSRLGYPGHCFHTGPLIHGKDEYEGELIENRQKMLVRFLSFTTQINMKHVEFYIEKKNRSKRDVQRALTNQIKAFIGDNLLYLSHFRKINIYYDFGQAIVSNILTDAFRTASLKPDYVKTKPDACRMLQVADFIVTLKLLSMKSDEGIASRSEITSFGGERKFKRVFLRNFELMEFSNRRIKS